MWQAVDYHVMYRSPPSLNFSCIGQAILSFCHKTIKKRRSKFRFEKLSAIAVKYLRGVAGRRLCRTLLGHGVYSFTASKVKPFGVVNVWHGVCDQSVQSVCFCLLCSTRWFLTDCSTERFFSCGSVNYIMGATFFWQLLVNSTALWCCFSVILSKYLDESYWAIFSILTVHLSLFILGFYRV